MLARAIRLMTGIDGFYALSAISWICLVFALPLFFEETSHRLGTERAWGPLLFLLLYPVAFFFAAAYTESLYLLLLLLAFRSVRLGQLPAAPAWSDHHGLTRAPAVAVGPALALAWWLGRRGSTRALPVAALALAPLAGVLAYTFGIGWLLGEPRLFFRSMGAFAHRTPNPIAGVLSFFREPIRLWTSGHFLRHPGAFAPYAHFFLFAILAAVQVRRRRWSDAAWVAGVLGLSVLTGTSAGVPRYTSTVFPGHILLFELFEGRPALRVAALALSTAILLLNSAYFVNWHFVS